MKRLHVHIHVRDLSESIGYYEALFGAEPSVRKDDYAKWMLDDPTVNLAISDRGGDIGFDHLGFQFDDSDKLAAVSARSGATTAIMPRPQLKVRAISAASTPPKPASQENTGGTGQEPPSMTALKPSGNTRGMFS